MAFLCLKIFELPACGSKAVERASVTVQHHWLEKAPRKAALITLLSALGVGGAALLGCSSAAECTAYYGLSGKKAQKLAVAQKWLTIRGPVLDVSYHPLLQAGSATVYDLRDYQDYTRLRVGESMKDGRHIDCLFDGAESKGLKLTDLKQGSRIVVRGRASSYGAGLFLTDTELVSW